MQYVSLFERVPLWTLSGGATFAINEIHNSTSNLVFICRSIISAIINPDAQQSNFSIKPVKGALTYKNCPHLNTVDDHDYRNSYPHSFTDYSSEATGLLVFVNIKVDI